MATVDNEVDAQMLLKSINVVEKSREILSVSLNGMVDAERVEDVKSHLRVRRTQVSAALPFVKTTSGPFCETHILPPRVL